MKHVDYWIKIFGITPDGGCDEDIHKISEILSKNTYGNKPDEKRTITKDGVLTLTYKTEVLRDEMINKLMRQMGSSLLLRHPVRMGSEEWTLPCNQEALMVLSTKGIPSD